MSIRSSDKSIFSFHIAQLIIYSFAVLQLLTSLLFFAGITVSKAALPVSCIIAAALLWVFYVQKSGKKIIAEILCFAVLTAVSVMIAGSVFDFSWDGNAYHKSAVALLRNGWNPLKETTEGLFEKLGLLSGASIWIDNYCQIAWRFGAAVYSITGNIETGKAYTLLAMICVLCISYYYFRNRKMSIPKAALISLCLATNPIAAVQMFSYYNDGFMQLILEVLVISLLMLSDKESFDYKVSVSLVFASMLVAGNIKFTGLLYGGIFCIAYYLRNCFAEYKKGEGWFKRCLRSGFSFAFVALVTFGLAGFEPYITNLIRHGSFTYPLTGEGKIDIVTDNSPFAAGNSRFYNLFRSLFSKMDNFMAAAQKETELKLPFTVDWDYEKYNVNGYDTRISGFGVLFSGVLVIAVIVLIVYFIAGKRDRRYGITAAVVLPCLLLTAFVSESWWARYAPYIYFLPLTAISLLFLSEKKAPAVPGIFPAVLGILLSLLLIANNLMPLSGIKEEYTASEDIRRNLDEVEGYDEIEIYNPYYQGVYFSVSDRGVSFTVNKDLEGKEDVNNLGYLNTIWKPVK